jgi:ATP-dependent RNA helicase DeaD
MIDKMQNVEVNEEQIEPYMDQIMKQLEYLDKTELLKRFVSLEFNRFLDYYKDSEDLNYHEKERGPRKERDEQDTRSGRSGRDSRDDSGDKRFRRGQKVRLKVNLGNREGINPKRLLGIINDIVGDKTISVGDIEVTNKFTFFDVFADQLDKVVDSFAQQKEITLAAARESTGYQEKQESPYRSRERSASRKKPTSNERENSRRPSSGRSSERSNSDKPWRNRR